MSYIEERNYWNDARVVAALKDSAYKILSCDKHRASVQLDEAIIEDLMDEHPEDFPEHFDGKVSGRTKFEVCDLCNGSGTTVNPSIDCCGLTAEDFAEDPDFHESYMRGDYDITCTQCHGERVVAEIEFEDERIAKAIESFRRSQADMAREIAYQSMMGF